MDYLVSNYKISVSENSLLISVDKKLWLAPYFITSLSSLPIVLFYFFIENNNFLFKGGIAFWFIFVTICCCIYAVIKIRKWWNEQNLEITFFNQEKLVRFQKPNKTIEIPYQNIASQLIEFEEYRMSDSSDEVCDLKIYLLQKTQEKQFLMDLLRRSSYTFSFKSKKKEVRKSAFLEGEKATNIIKQFCGIDYEIHELC